MRSPVRAWPRPAALAAAVVVGGALLLTSCAGTGFHYVKSSDYHTYFKVPDAWKLYDQNSLLAGGGSGLSQDEIAQAKATSWSTGFDASPRPELSHLSSASGNYPIGIAKVQQISAQDADSVSLSTLRNLFFDIDGTQTGDTAADIVTYEPVNLSGGFHGAHLVARLGSGDKAFTVNQIVVVDEATSKIYALVISCDNTCYQRNQSKIDQVMNSWTVRDS